MDRSEVRNKEELSKSRRCLNWKIIRKMKTSPKQLLQSKTIENSLIVLIYLVSCNDECGGTPRNREKLFEQNSRHQSIHGKEIYLWI